MLDPNQMKDFLLLAPEILLASAGLLLLLFGTIGRGLGNREASAVSIVSLVLTALVLLRVEERLEWRRYVLLDGSFVIDGFSFFWKMLVLLATALTILISYRF
ncbi:MAG TPA: hypothetical protein VH394_09385, partial [Thermoanaerobaculia bacterium]|nr:hypothetical protein [Thermoanaerobaculia bacterium]